MDIRAILLIGGIGAGEQTRPESFGAVPLACLDVQEFLTLRRGWCRTRCRPAPGAGTGRLRRDDPTSSGPPQLCNSSGGCEQLASGVVRTERFGPNGRGRTVPEPVAAPAPGIGAVSGERLRQSSAKCLRPTATGSRRLAGTQCCRSARQGSKAGNLAAGPVASPSSRIVAPACASGKGKIRDIGTNYQGHIAIRTACRGRLWNRSRKHHRHARLCTWAREARRHALRGCWFSSGCPPGPQRPGGGARQLIGTIRPQVQFSIGRQHSRSFCLPTKGGYRGFVLRWRLHRLSCAECGAFRGGKSPPWRVRAWRLRHGVRETSEFPSNFAVVRRYGNHPSRPWL